MRENMGWQGLVRPWLSWYKIRISPPLFEPRPYLC